MDSKILSLYLGCPIKRWNSSGQFFGATLDGVSKEGAHSCFDTVYEVLKPDEFKLILRPLSSMTEEEATEYLKLKYNAVEQFNFVNKDLSGYGGFWYSVGAMASKPIFIMLTQIQDGSRADQFQYLLSKHFDLFGLIEKGEAIENLLVEGRGKITGTTEAKVINWPIEIFQYINPALHLLHNGNPVLPSSEEHNLLQTLWNKVD